MDGGAQYIDIMGPCRSCDVPSRDDWRTTPMYDNAPTRVSVGRRLMPVDDPIC